VHHDVLLPPSRRRLACALQQEPAETLSVGKGRVVQRPLGWALSDVGPSRRRTLGASLSVRLACRISPEEVGGLGQHMQPSTTAHIFPLASTYRLSLFLSFSTDQHPMTQPQKRCLLNQIYSNHLIYGKLSMYIILPRGARSLYLPLLAFVCPDLSRYPVEPAEVWLSWAH